MKHLSRWLRVASIGVALTAFALTGCTVKTTVQTTATTSPDVTHLYVTVQEVWFTSSATDTPADDGWVKKVLATPVTVDLASLNGGSLETLTSLQLPATTYSQMRLVLADASATLASSASDLGLTYNNAVQYVDSSGVSRIVPLEFATPNSSLLIPLSIKLNAVGSSQVLASSTASTSTTTSTTTSTEATATISMDVDALRNLTLFTYGTATGALLSPGLQAYDESEVGTITGTFDVSAISSTALASAQGIIVSAEVPSSDGTRYTLVKSSRLDSSGSFTLYPLPVDSTAGTTSYDIVVHGPGVETLIVTGIPVTTGDSIELQSSAITLPASTSFVINTSNATVPGGTQVDFYQTLPSNSLPYFIESAAVNPFGGNFTADVSLATGPLVYGAYNSDNLIAFASITAQEGTATYQIVTDAPQRAASAFGTTVAGASSGSTTAVSITLPQPNLPAGAVTRAISGTINLSTAGKYDALYVLVSRGGQLIDAINLSTSLGANSSVNFSANVPGGTTGSVYDVAVRAWNSADAANTLTRVAVTTQADVRSNDVSGLSATL
jgi:hypothetical protein